MEKLLLSFLIAMLLSSLGQTRGGDHKLLVLNIDGFGANFFDKFQPGDLPGFEGLINNGVKADSLKPMFPTLSMVNYYSLMTGLYPEVHGHVNNYMIDPIHHSVFLLGNNRPEQDQPFWWDDGEPLWVTAAKQNKRSYMWYWNGCEAEIRGYRPEFCAPYQDHEKHNVSFYRQTLRYALGNLSEDNADLAGVYFDKLDLVAHAEGPDGPGVSDLILQLDQVFSDLLTWIDEFNLEDILNVVIFSDHGMQRANNKIDLMQYITTDQLSEDVNSRECPVMQLWPADGELDKVYDALSTVPHMTVYKREDIPERYHLKHHYRVSPLLAVSVDEDYIIIRPNKTASSVIGFHGYDNEMPSMHGIFIAYGPDFVKGYDKPTFENIEIYQVMCHVLEIKAAPNNGTWSNMCDVLEDARACEVSSATRHTSFIALFLSLLFFMIGRL